MFSLIGGIATSRHRPVGMRCSRLGISNVEPYRPGGFRLTTAIGDMTHVVGEGRYAVLHKLSFGGSFVVWLARDLMPPSPPITLKITAAEAPARPVQEIPE